jgi:hypothetical protein
MVLLSWKDVIAVHQTIAGINVKNGLPISILVNQEKGGYSDEVTSTELIYVLSKNTQTHGINALLRIVGQPHPVRAFEKVGKDKWLDLGNWEAKEVIEDKGEEAIRIRFLRVG